MTVDPQNLSTRPFRVHANGDVDMSPECTFDANGSTFVNLGAPQSPDDAATKRYVDTTVAGHTLASTLSAGNSANGSKITNLGAPDSASDAATKKYVDDALSGYAPPVPSFSDVLTEVNATGGTPIESDDHEEAPLRVANTSIEYEEEIGPRQLSVSPVPAKVRVHRRAASGVLEDDMMTAPCLEVGLHADDWPEPGLIVAEAEVAIWNDDFSNAYACKVFGSYSVSAEGAITLQHTSFLGDELPDGLSDPAFSTSSDVACVSLGQQSLGAQNWSYSIRATYTVFDAS